MRTEILQFDFPFMSCHSLCEIAAPFENCAIHMLSAAFYIKYICYLKTCEVLVLERSYCLLQFQVSVDWCVSRFECGTILLMMA